MVLVVDTRLSQNPNALMDEGYHTASPQKASPFKDFSLRYPPPDPTDPFAPLSTLRNRRSTLQGILSPGSNKVNHAVQKSEVRKNHSSIDMLPFVSPPPRHDSRTKKAANSTLKVQSGMPEKASQNDNPTTPASDFERRRSLSTPTPVSSLLRPSATISPSQHKPQLDAVVERSRPFTLPDVRLATIHSTADEVEVPGTSSTFKSLFSSTAMEEKSSKTLRSHNSNPQLATLAATSPGPGSKRMNLSQSATSKKGHNHMAPPANAEAASEGSTSPTSASSSSSRTVTPSLKSISPESSINAVPSSPNSTIAAERPRNRRATIETPSLISSKSLSSTSTDSSAPVFNVVVPAPSHDIASSLYQHSKKSLSNPRLSGKTLHGPTASLVSQPSASSVLRSRHPGPSSTSGGISKLPFDPSYPPTMEQLSRAASIDVIAESGVRVPFGRLFMGQKTIICFIRHFWCSFCQDYMFSISSTVDPTVLRKAGVNLVIISNGSYQMIKPYRNIFGISFPVYTDPSLKLYAALGMTRRTTDGGPESSRGSYVRHGSFTGMARVVLNAFRHGMPFFEKRGDMAQLGGEFVLGPGLKHSFAHRMVNTRSHTPILHVVKAAVGISEPIDITVTRVPEMTEEERAKMHERRQQLVQKTPKRGGGQLCEQDSCGPSTVCAPPPKLKRRSKLIRILLMQGNACT